MRTATVSLLAGACLMQAAGAFAADLDYGVLRGSDYEPAPPPTIDWSGVYVGGHGGWSSTAHGFGTSLQPLVASNLYQTTIEKEHSVSGFLRPESVRTTGGSFGAFGGYNFVADDFVFGIEVDYTYMDKTAASGGSIGRTMATTGDGYTNFVYLNGISRTTLSEYGTVRGRVGYALGSLLPFATAGFALGRARVSDNVSILAAGYNTADAKAAATNPGLPVGNYGYTNFNASAPDRGFASPDVVSRVKAKYVGGFAAGFGLDFALTSNIFLRGEYQYILFDDFDSHKANVNTVRAAAAVKF